MAKDIIGFYLGISKNQQGYYIDDILNFNDEELENNHCYIQWVFPLPEKSRAVPESPILRQRDIETFNNCQDLQGKMLKALERMAKFYGFGDKEKMKRWITPRNHNFLRITRILRSMCLLGNSKLAKELHQYLCDEVYKENEAIIGPVTKQYWDEAIERDF